VHLRGLLLRGEEERGREGRRRGREGRVGPPIGESGSASDVVTIHLLYGTINKKAQLSLTNPRDACEKFARFT